MLDQPEAVAKAKADDLPEGREREFLAQLGNRIRQHSHYIENARANIGNAGMELNEMKRCTESFIADSKKAAAGREAVSVSAIRDRDVKIKELHSAIRDRDQKIEELQAFINELQARGDQW